MGVGLDVTDPEPLSKNHTLRKKKMLLSQITRQDCQILID